MIDEGCSKNNLTNLRLWLNRGEGGSADRESFYMKKYCRLLLFC